MVIRTFLLALLLSAGLGAQQSKPQTSQGQPGQPQQQEPPEEDETLAPKEYNFNPLQATKEVTIGNYYFKKGNYRAAAKRFTEASRWNPNYAEAFLRLGDADEKLKDEAGARQAYGKYLELAPDAKNADAIRKKLARKR